MAKFVTGDKVRKSNGMSFANGQFIHTVKETMFDYTTGRVNVFFEESTGWLNEEKLTLDTAYEPPLESVLSKVQGTMEDFERELETLDKQREFLLEKINELKITERTLKAYLPLEGGAK